MERPDVLNAIRQQRIIALVRPETPEALVQAAAALQRGGIRILEVAVNTPAGISALSEASRRCGADVLLGAGNILDGETAASVIEAGAAFVASPITDREMIATCNTLERLAIAGALTPTEIVAAARLGADMVKVFPCDSVRGPAYIEAVGGPLDEVPLLAAGGIDPKTAPDFLRAGATAVSAASALVDAQVQLSGQWDRLERAAAEFVVAVRGSASA